MCKLSEEQKEWAVSEEEKKKRKELMKEQEKYQFSYKFEEDKRRFGLSREEDIRRYGLGRQAGIEASQEGEQQFLGGSGTPLPELAQLQSQILQGATPAQGMADRRTALALRESGVRGPEAGLERSRQSGMMNQELQEMLARYSLGEAGQRRDKRLDYFGQKALRGQAATY